MNNRPIANACPPSGVRMLHLGLMAALLTVLPLSAQNQEDAVELEALSIEGLPVEQIILPHSRPLDSVYGLEMSVLEIPRSVTIISRQQLDSINIESVRDFSKLTSSSYTRTNFGAPTTPDLRAQIADIYVNGMRRGLSNNGNGLPINFNSVESVNILKGPASVVYGASQYVGGYADFITKRPYFDKARGEVSVVYGSYDERRWAIDYGTPLSERMAVRLSYSGEYSGGFYHDSHMRTQAIYLAATWKPSEDYQLFLNGEFFHADYTENFGLNRPTQQMIDRGLYLTGINANQPPGTPASDEQNSRYVTSGFPVQNQVVYGAQVPFDRSWRLHGPDDNSIGNSFQLQAIQTWQASELLTIENNTFFYHIVRDTDSNYYYTEIIDPSWRLENRTEARLTGNGHQLNAGISLWYQHVRAFNNYYFEPANVWDVSRGTEFIDARRSVEFPGFGAYEVPGWPGRYASAGVFNFDTNDSRVWSFGPFLQEVWSPVESLHLLGGVRYERLDVHSRDPLVPSGLQADDRGSVWLLNYNLGATYRLAGDWVAYANWNYSENPGGAASNGGGFGYLEDPDGNGTYTIQKHRLEQESELAEIGLKAALLEAKLFLSTTVFTQTRSNPQRTGEIVEYQVQGWEWEANYQPNKNFFATFSWTWMFQAEVNQPEFYVANNTLHPQEYLSGQPYPDWGTYTFGIWPSLGSPSLPRQGVPDHLFNALVSYTFDNGLGFTLAGVVTGEINSDVLGQIVIPWQFNLDASVHYSWRDWELRLTVLNATDETNFAAPDEVYGSESILIEPPVRFEFRATRSF